VKLDYVSIESATASPLPDRKANLNAFNEKLVVRPTRRRAFDDRKRTWWSRWSTECVSAGFDLAPWTVGRVRPTIRRYRAYGGVRLCRAWEMPRVAIAAISCSRCRRSHCARMRLAWLARDAVLHTRGQDRSEPAVGALPRLITLVGPARAKRITIMCEKMPAAQALGGVGR
jgi:hypothetical protein